MSNRTLKVTIGILAAVLILVGGFAVLKNAGVFNNNSNAGDAPVMEGTEAATMATAPSVSDGQAS